MENSKGVRRLILAKHSAPQVDPSTTAAQWRLFDAGRERCGLLAEELCVYGLTAIISSTEPKAVETAEIVSKYLGIPSEPVEGLHEHDRSNTPFYPAEADFQAAVREFFAAPDHLVMGRETANQARARYTNAIEKVVADHPEGNIAVVSHGTVMSLFIAARAAREPYDYWRRLKLPSYAVMSLPGYGLVTTIEQLV